MSRKIRTSAKAIIKKPKTVIIDIMAVTDNLSVGDLKTYQKAIVSIGNFDQSRRKGVAF